MPDCPFDVPFGLGHGVGECDASGETGGDAGGEGATGAVGRLALDSWTAQFYDPAAVIEEIHSVWTVKVPPGDHDRRGAKLPQAGAGLGRRCERSDRVTSQRLGLKPIWCDDPGAWKETGAHEFDCVVIE